MRLSSRARYALRLMLDIARHGGEATPVPLAAVAHRTDLSHGYLEQLSTGLRQAGLLRGVAGRKGGYVLERAPSEIRIGDVVQASIGEVCLVECVREPSICARASRCETRALYCLLNQKIEDVFNSLTLADLMDTERLARYGGFDPHELQSAPDGPDPCPTAQRPRRGRLRIRKRALAVS
jgi:Rrf2 family cysteine metabolism transcriptional repressor